MVQRPRTDSQATDADEAWVIFRLSSTPIRMEEDGDLHCVALMDVATGFLLGIEMVPVEVTDTLGSAAPSLLGRARERGYAAGRLVVPASGMSVRISTLAMSMRMQVDEAADADLAELLEEPRSSFAERFGGKLQ